MSRRCVGSRSVLSDAPCPRVHHERRARRGCRPTYIRSDLSTYTVCIWFDLHVVKLLVWERQPLQAGRSRQSVLLPSQVRKKEAKIWYITNTPELRSESYLRE